MSENFNEVKDYAIEFEQLIVMKNDFKYICKNFVKEAMVMEHLL